MTENVISFNTRKPAAVEELEDPLGVAPELQDSFREALKSFSEKVETGEITTMVISTLDIHGMSSMFFNGETGPEVIGIASVLHHHTMRLMDAAADE